MFVDRESLFLLKINTKNIVNNEANISNNITNGNNILLIAPLKFLNINTRYINY